MGIAELRIWYDAVAFKPAVNGVAYSVAAEEACMFGNDAPADLVRRGPANQLDAEFALSMMPSTGSHTLLSPEEQAGADYRSDQSAPTPGFETLTRQERDDWSIFTGIAAPNTKRVS